MVGTPTSHRSVRRLVLLWLALVFGLAALAPSATAGVAGTATVDLKTASGYAALSGASIGNTVSAPGAPRTTLHGDLGVKPDTQPTGFPPGVVTGTRHVGDAAAAQAHADVSAAYAEVAARTGGAVLPGALAGTTVAPGLHTIAGAGSNTTTVTLDAGGDRDAVFVFQVGGALAMAAGSRVVLAGGARADHVFWQVNGAGAVGAGARFAGTLMAHDAVGIGNGTTVNGRAFALGGALTLDENEVFSAAPDVTISGGATATTPDSTPTLSGTTDVESPGVVTVTVNGETLTVTPAGGAWSLAAPRLANGTYTITASVTDAVGNERTATQRLTVDTVPPLLRIDGGPAVATNDATPTLTGTTDADPGTVVRVLVGSQSRAALVDDDGRWNVTPAPLADGTVTVTASVADPAGNSTTAVQELTVDTTAPALTIDGGATALTNDATPVLAGTTDEAQGTPVTVTLADETLTTAVGTGGAWSVPVSRLSDGPHRVTATVTDAVGNGTAAVQRLTVDTVAPVVAIDGGSSVTTANTAPTITGTSDAPAATTVTVTLAGQTRTTLVQPNGTWNATPEVVGPGTWTVTAAVADPAGNVGRATQTLTISPASPGAPAPPPVAPVAPAPASEPPPTPAVPPAVTPSPASPVAVVAPSRSARARVRGSVLRSSITVRCPAAAKVACAGRIVFSAPRSRGAKRVRIGSSRFKVRPGRKARIVVKLNRRGKRLLAHVRRLEVTLVTTTRNGAGRRVRTRARVTLKVTHRRPAARSRP